MVVTMHWELLSLTVLWRWLIGRACAWSALKKDAQKSTFRRGQRTLRVSNSQGFAMRPQPSLQRKTTNSRYALYYWHKYVTQRFDHHQNSHQYHRQSSRKSNIVNFCGRYLSASHHTLVDEAAGRKHSSSAPSASTAESSVCFRGRGDIGTCLIVSHMVRQDNILATHLKTMCALEHQKSRPNFSTGNPLTFH